MQGQSGSRILLGIVLALCCGLAAVSVYFLLDQDRPLNVKFWTATLIAGSALAGLTASRLVTGQRVE